MVRNRRGKVVAGLIVAAMLASLGACTRMAPAPAGGGEQAPGSFKVQLHGQMTDLLGGVQP